MVFCIVTLLQACEDDEKTAEGSFSSTHAKVSEQDCMRGREALAEALAEVKATLGNEGGRGSGVQRIRNQESGIGNRESGTTQARESRAIMMALSKTPSKTLVLAYTSRSTSLFQPEGVLQVT